MDSLKNKKVLIVGATGGIGAHLVKLIHNSGAQVWIAGRQIAKLNLIAESNQLPASIYTVVKWKAQELYNQLNKA